MNTKLVNFHIPLRLSNDLDSINQYRRVSRTSVLNTFLENYVRSETKKIKEDGVLNELLQSVRSKNLPIPRKTKSKSSWSSFMSRNKSDPVVDDYEPPSIPSFDEDDEDSWRQELIRG
jgi:hypothetical protein